MFMFMCMFMSFIFPQIFLQDMEIVILMIIEETQQHRVIYIYIYIHTHKVKIKIVNKRIY
jgi:hypothetical protein